MRSFSQAKYIILTAITAGLIVLTGSSRSARAQDPFLNHESANLIVNVHEADSGEAVSQAAVTVTFTEPVAFGHGKKHTYNAKTDAQGRCKLSGVNKGTIVLMITATHHQSYGKELQFEHDNQVFQVKLKKPQPLI